METIGVIFAFLTEKNYEKEAIKIYVENYSIFFIVNYIGKKYSELIIANTFDCNTIKENVCILTWSKF